MDKTTRIDRGGASRAHFLDYYYQLRKHKWLILSALFLTVLYVFLVEMTKLEPVFRVVSFLILAVILIIISTVYSRMRTKKTSAKSAKETGTKEPSN